MRSSRFWGWWKVLSCFSFQISQYLNTLTFYWVPPVNNWPLLLFLGFSNHFAVLPLLCAASKQKQIITKDRYYFVDLFASFPLMLKDAFKRGWKFGTFTLFQVGGGGRIFGQWSPSDCRALSMQGIFYMSKCTLYSFFKEEPFYLFFPTWYRGATF